MSHVTCHIKELYYWGEKVRVDFYYYIYNIYIIYIIINYIYTPLPHIWQVLNVTCDM